MQVAYRNASINTEIPYVNDEICDVPVNSGKNKNITWKEISDQATPAKYMIVNKLVRG